MRFRQGEKCKGDGNEETDSPDHRRSEWSVLGVAEWPVIHIGNLNTFDFNDEPDADNEDPGDHGRVFWDDRTREELDPAKVREA